MIHIKRTAIICSMILVFISAQLSAFQLIPMTNDFAASGVNARKSYTIVNNSDKPLAVKVSLLKREMDIYGEETLTDASELFFLYPKQTVIQPGKSQTVRVQWKGASVVQKELSFRINAEQLPIDFTPIPNQANINMLFIYSGTVYILPQKIETKVEVVSLDSSINEAGEKILLLELNNTGTTHALMVNPRIAVTSKSFGRKDVQMILEDKDLTGFSRENILVGNRRIFTIPWPEGLPDGNLTAELLFDPVR